MVRGCAGVTAPRSPAFALVMPRQGFAVSYVFQGHRWRRLNVHGRVLESLRCLPHVIGALLGQPHAGIPATFRTQPGFDAQGHFWGDSSAAIKHTRQGHAGHIQLLRGLGDSQPQRGQNIIAQRQARVRGG